MTRQTATTAAIAILTAAIAASTASAQVVAYHHRSTAYGDFMAGYGEAVHAEGLAARNHAIAYRTIIQSERDRNALNYEIVQNRLYLKQYRVDAIQQKIETRRDAQQQKTLAENAAAQQLLANVQRGVQEWPEALQRPEFAQSMKLIQRLMQNWTPDGTSADNAYRKALLTEAAVLKNKVASNTDIDYHSRLQAVNTLSKVGRLAKMDAMDIAAGSIAMR